MRNGKLVVAQIGCGKFAEFQDLPNIAAIPQLQLKWLCDLDTERAGELSRRYGAEKVTSDFREICADPEVDLIKIATSHEIHLPIIECAASAGKHVFCEKPMAMRDEEAWKIIRTVRKNGIKLCVDLNRRMSPAPQALKRNVEEHLKNPVHSPWRYIETARTPLAEEEYKHMMIRIQDESSSYGLQHLDPLIGGGEIIGESVHWLDVACWFFAPAVPVEITAWGSSRLSHGINVKFSSGDDMTLTFSCSGTFDYPKELFEVAAGNAFFRSEFFVENNTYGVPGAETEYFPMKHYSGNIAEEGFNAYIAKYHERLQGFAGNSKTLENSKPFEVDKGHLNMWRAFVDAVLNDKPSPCDELDGFRSTYLAQLAIRSIECRQTLPVPVERWTPAIFIR
ncbi:MAG: Gfo/Idh/MocA family oxidoreductase [Lentisphaeria bacterium]|nr:Gfo/Idh/MocA family oxidoreductase [Lentisphaeria bacterium]